MAEEVIRVKEGTETAAQPESTAEPMGTVISMESVKPAVEQKEDISSVETAEAVRHDQEKKRVSDFFHLRKDMEEFTREDWILSRIPEEDLMEYLAMEQKKSEMLQNAKETKEKRIFTTIQIAISMAAIVAVVALLKDNPTVLVNILYITGIVIALWIWRGKQDK